MQSVSICCAMLADSSAVAELNRVAMAMTTPWLPLRKSLRL